MDSRSPQGLAGATFSGIGSEQEQALPASAPEGINTEDECIHAQVEFALVDGEGTIQVVLSHNVRGGHGSHSCLHGLLAATTH